MALYFYSEFLRDLRNEGDSKFARRVLSKILDAACNFPADRDDHRYEGIENAWIRYVSLGRSGIRVIYIQKGQDIYFYRAGPHSVEDNLASPRDNAALVPVVPVSPNVRPSASASTLADAGYFLQNYQKTYIRTALLSRRFAPHAAVTLVSPFLSPELFSIFSPFGKVLQDLSAEGARLTLITLPPATLDALKFFSNLEKEGMSVLFHPKLHAKLYLFEEAQLEGLSSPPKKIALVGSANLTISGIGIGADSREVTCANEELAYQLPENQFEQALDYVIYLTISSSDIPKERVRLIRNKQ